jgi:two-component system NarL family response regulator
LTTHGPAPHDRRTAAVADVTPMFLQGLVAVLANEGFEVSAGATAGDVRDQVAKGPDIIVVDLRLLREEPSLHLLARDLGVPIVVCVGRGDEEVLDLVQDGVNGLWDREGDVAELRRIVTGAMSGSAVVSPDVGAGLLNRIARASEAARGTAGRLTSREREILELMADGVGNRAIADALFISENTVRNHVRNVLDKLQARTRTEAVVRAVRAGLIRLS